MTFNKEKHFKQIRIIISGSCCKNFVLFSNDDFFDVFTQNLDSSLSENDQVNKIISDLLPNNSFVVHFDSVVEKKNMFSLFYCTANNIDNIKNGKVVEINV